MVNYDYNSLIFFNIEFNNPVLTPSVPKSSHILNPLVILIVILMYTTFNDCQKSELIFFMTRI